MASLPDPVATAIFFSCFIEIDVTQETDGQTGRQASTQRHRHTHRQTHEQTHAKRHRDGQSRTSLLISYADEAQETGEKILPITTCMPPRVI